MLLAQKAWCLHLPLAIAGFSPPRNLSQCSNHVWSLTDWGLLANGSWCFIVLLASKAFCGRQPPCLGWSLSTTGRKRVRRITVAHALANIKSHYSLFFLGSPLVFHTMPYFISLAGFHLWIQGELLLLVSWQLDSACCHVEDVSLSCQLPLHCPHREWEFICKPKIKLYIYLKIPLNLGITFNLFCFVGVVRAEIAQWIFSFLSGKRCGLARHISEQSFDRFTVTWSNYKFIFARPLSDNSFTPLPVYKLRFALKSAFYVNTGTGWYLSR